MIRAAGEVVDTSVLASLEYGAEHLAILANVEQVINDLIVNSQILRHTTERGDVQVVGGAYYELGSGRVIFSEPAKTAPATPHK